MMQGLRDNMKLIIWITAIVFLVGFGILQLGGVFDLRTPGAGAGPQGVIAEVNGEPIRLDAFNQTYQQLVDQLRQERELREGEDSYVREQAWEQIVRNTLMMQEAKRRGITVSAEEIKSAVRYAPPQFLVQAELFKTNGQFDYRKYVAELENPNSQVPWGQIEALIASQLPLQKLQERIVAAAKVSDGDVRDRFLLQNERIGFHYIQFAADSFPIDTSKIGGADVEAYYKSHPEEFRGPEEAKLQVTMVPRVPDASDFAAARERLLPLWDEVKASPDSFEARAKVYSEIGSAVKGGAIPAPTPYDGLRPIFQRGLANVTPGHVSDILQEERSLHIFRVDSRGPDPTTKRDMIMYHEIAVRVQPGSAAIRTARDKVKTLIDAAKREGLSAAATKRGYLTRESPWFSMGNAQNDMFDRFPDIEAWVFSAKVGSVSRSLPAEAGWYVYQILDQNKAGTRPLSKVTTEARARLIRSLEVERAKAAAEQARAEIAAGAKPEDVAARHHAVYSSASAVTRNGFMGNLGHDPKIVGAAMSLPVGSWSQVLSGTPGAVLFHVDDHTVPSEAEFQKMAPGIHENLMAERRQVLFLEWLKDVRRTAKIKDYRENYFDV